MKIIHSNQTTWRLKSILLHPQWADCPAVSFRSVYLHNKQQMNIQMLNNWVRRSTTNWPSCNNTIINDNVRLWWLCAAYSELFPIFPLLWNGPWGNCRHSCCLVFTEPAQDISSLRKQFHCLESFSFDSDKRDFLSSCPKWIFLPIKGFLPLFANYGTEYESNWIENLPIPPNCKNRK